MKIEKRWSKDKAPKIMTKEEYEKMKKEKENGKTKV